jgi:large subunit ribosomal protein L6
MSEIYSRELEINDNVSIEIENLRIKVKGPNATLEKDFNHARQIDIVNEKGLVTVKANNSKKKSKSIVGTISSHIDNMIKGSLADFKVIQKIVYAHFPFTVRVEDNLVLVENFLGERSPRRSKIIGDKTKVEISGDDVITYGPDIENVTQTAANITLSTKIKNKDPRIFQDGVYKYKVLYDDEVIWELKL